MKNLKLDLKTTFLLSSLFFVLSMQSQELETLLNEALANNPKIQKFELQYKIASEKVNEVDNIPNTDISVGYFISEPETRTGAQRFKVSAKQMLPWFGTVSARENYISSLAEATYEDIAIAKRNLVTEVSQTYYNLYTNKVQQTILIENLELLKTYETLALNSVETGKTSVVSVLQLQIRQNELQQLKDNLYQQFLSTQKTMNLLLNRAENTPILIITSLEIPEENFNFDEKKLAFHPELLKYDKLYESIRQSEILNQKESNPMIGFGLDYVAVSERPNMSFTDNGKDIVMPMLSVSIPIFNKKYKSKTQQNKLQQQEIKTQKQDRLNTLQTTLTKAIHARAISRISYTTHTKNLIQAKKAQEILLRKYETNTTDFNEILDIQALQLKFQMNQVEAVKNYYLQTTIINYLIH